MKKRVRVAMIFDLRKTKMLIRNCNVRNPKSALKYSNHNEKKKSFLETRK